MGRNRRRIYALVASAAVAGTLLVVGPALGQESSGEVDAVTFTVLGPDGPRFEYGDEPDQLLTTARNGCQITSPESLIALSASNSSTGKLLPPGLYADSIGVKSSGSNSNGTPCSQTDSSEILTIGPGPSLGGALFSKVELDLEMTGNAIVLLTFSDGTQSADFKLHTGTSANAFCAEPHETAPPGCDGDSNPQSGPYEVTSGPGDLEAACAAPQGSGPNSGANDNCIWTVEPGFDFDVIDLTVVDVGTVSLEGGGDTNMPTLFHLAPDRIGCDENVTFGGGDQPTYTVRAENGGVECSKEVTFDASDVTTEGDQFVLLTTTGTGEVVFLERLEFLPESRVSDSQIPFELWYDDVLAEPLDPQPAEFCLLDPRVEGDFDLAAAYDSAAESAAVLPTGETTCIISAEFVTVGTDETDSQLIKAVYHLYNRNDGFRTFK